jgi:hypothetical protein
VATVYAELAARSTPAEDEAFLALQHTGGVRSHLGAGSLAGAPGPRTRVLAARGSYLVTEFEQEPTAFPGLADEAGCCGWLVSGDRREPVPAAPGGHGDIHPVVLAAIRLPGRRGTGAAGARCRPLVLHQRPGGPARRLSRSARRAGLSG